MSARRQVLLRAAAVAAVAFAIDQISKAAVRSSVRPGERVELIAGIDLVRVGNEGIAFGLLDGTGSVAIVLAAAAFVALLGYFLAVSHRGSTWIPIGLLAGGALGNLTDRITEGAVTDFIDPPSWPAFNVADIEITAGVIVLAIIYLRGGEEP